MNKNIKQLIEYGAHRDKQQKTFVYHYTEFNYM